MRQYNALTWFSNGAISAILMEVLQCLNLFFFKHYISHNEINTQTILHIKNKIRRYFILITYMGFARITNGNCTHTA